MNQGVCKEDLSFRVGESILSALDPCPENRCKSSAGKGITRESFNCEVCPGNVVCNNV